MDKPDLHSTAHYFLEGLNEIGIEHLFCNLGTDHAPLVEEMARWRKAGKKFPKVFLCPHENTAVHMAAGYTMVTGRAQGVLVHVDAGTANAAIGMHNLFRSRIPVLVMAGKAPYTIHGELAGSRDTYVHFIQEPFDQTSLVRPYLKWDYNLPSGVVAKEALRRAHSIMMSDPKGPVYLTLPRETLAATWSEAAIRSFPEDRYGAAPALGADPQAVANLAERLLAAKNPVLITCYAGRNRETPALIDELARFAGMRVFEYTPIHLNIPRNSPCFAGFMPGKAVGDADFGLLVDVDVPWIPLGVSENPAAFWAQIDVDVMKQSVPMWGFPSHFKIQGSSRRVLAQLLEAMREKASPAYREAGAQRLAGLRSDQQARTEAMTKLSLAKGGPGRINAHYLCAELARAIEPEDIVVNEAIVNGVAVLNQIPRDKPGSFLGLGGGALGWSSGVALGAKLAAPERMVVQFCGDGAFYLGNPQSAYAVSKHYGLPIFTVIIDNAGWAAVKAATLQMYPDGDAKSTGEYQSLLAPQMDFAKAAESAGAWGEVVAEPDQVPGAIRRCVEKVRGGQSAVLHARVTPISS